MVKKLLALSILFMIVFSNFQLFAGTTGKIAGVITDAQTGGTLGGVNVFLENMPLGAATDLDGYFVILNVPPGNYTLNVDYIGYADHTISNIVIKIDLTTRLNIELKSEIIETETVIVEAKRPIITRDISNSQINIEPQMIENMPVKTVTEVLTLQAGVEIGTTGIIVRGGGSNQTRFMIDGLTLNDERSNIPYTALSLSSIQEINFQTGGFTAEYGDMRSGIVNIVTKEGKVDKYSGVLNFKISPPTMKHFGPSLYDKYSYFNRPYLDPDVSWEGTENGAWDTYTKRQYFSFEGWKAVSNATLQDNNPDNDLSPQGAMEVFKWQRRRQGDIDKPDYVLDGGFGGPVPVISKQLGNLRFYLSHFQEQDLFIFPLSRDGYTGNNTQLKLTSDITPSMKLMVTALYGEEHSVSPYSWTTTPTGRLLRSDSEVADLTNSTSGNSVIYMPDYYSPGDIFRNMIGLKFTHVISSHTYYDVFLQRMANKNHVFQAETRDTSKVFQPIDGYYVDEAPYGYWGYSTSAVDGMSMGGWMNLGRDRTKNSTITFKYDLTTQFNNKNQIKTGLKVVYNDYDIKSSTFSPSMTTWTREMNYQVNPYRMAVYAQDKLEYEDFVANLGLRMDYSVANTDNFMLDSYSEYYKAGESYGHSIDNEAPNEKSKKQLTLNPRLGISHPITVNSKLYFNYGHYRSEASSSYRFRLQRESDGRVTYLGNPNLDLEKTIAYELGYEHNLSGIFLLKLAAYYKDVSNQPAWVRYVNLNGQINYNKMSNNFYEDIRGFEVTLNKRMGRWISGLVNYTYDVHTSGYFGLLQYWQDPNSQKNYLQTNPYQSKPRPQPYARANLNIHTPEDFGPEWFGQKPLTDWNLNIRADWRAGSYYTYNPNDTPGILYNTQWRDYHNVDLRFSKMFKVNRYNFQFYMDIDNVFNVKRLSWAGLSDSYDRNDYLRSLHFSFEEGAENGNDKIGDYRPVGVDFVPLESVMNMESIGNPSQRALYYNSSTQEYWRWDGADWNRAEKSYVKKVKDDKAYIDMPNIKSLSFLYPRDIMFGLKISF